MPAGPSLGLLSASIQLHPGCEIGPHEVDGTRLISFRLDKSSGHYGARFPHHLPLEHSFSAIFGVRAAKNGGRHITPPSSEDQLTSKLPDKMNLCSTLAGAATNNVVLLAYTIAKDMRTPPPSSAELDHIGTAADTISNLCFVFATCCA